MTTKVGKSEPHFLLPLAFLLVLALAFSGCGVKLIAEYDAIIDRYVTDLQAGIETFLVKMERTAGTPDGQYRNNAGFYDQIKGSLNSILSRANSLPQNELVVAEINLLRQNVENLRQIHENQGEKGLTPPLIEPIRAAFEAQLTAIIKLQHALKRSAQR
ncbi:hypothetical protein EDC14_100836 [Hydrogenispora ethanolica]|jgi:hypothetical protein|uniref:Lipoprotein n=1 Tax=Hydrogenispora ethanolica TaxID=1082276 RepID=A0A4R1RW48_HYDET|nr:hypothetical protein [Hydrogenispora ethanolica]TCL70891.1 hypothetical protein EDC14_100836 [Hydrogenispora ethanolica]